MDEIDITTKLKDFIYYFLHQTEDKFAYYLNILEENSEGKPNTLTGTILSSAASAIPKIGKGISTVIKKGDNLIAKRSEKETAFALSAIVYQHREDKERIRKVLIEAAYELFCCYEAQFSNITCHGGPIRAVHKLGCDASLRFIRALIKDKITQISREFIIGAITCDDSTLLQELGILKKGRAISSDDDKWNSAEIYRKPGLYAEGVFYRMKKTDSQTYGHRRRFSHEELEEWQVDEHSSSHQYITDRSNFAQDYEDIMAYIARKNPEEFAEYDREIKQQQTMMALKLLAVAEEDAKADREKKHGESLEFSEKLHGELKVEHEQTRQEVAGALQKLEVDKQNEVTKSDLEALERAFQQKMEEKPVVKVHLLDGDRINKELKKIDPTRTKEFKKLKKKLKKIF